MSTPADRLRAAAHAALFETTISKMIDADKLVEQYMAPAIDDALGYTELWEAAREALDESAGSEPWWERLRAALGMEE